MTSKRKGAKTSSTATPSSSTKTRASAKKCISTSSSSEDLQTSLPTDSGFNSACAQCRKSHKACVGGIPCERCKRLNYECAAVPKKRRGRPPKNSSVGSKRSRKSSNSTTRAAPPAKRKKTSSASSAPKRRRPSPVSSPESCNEWSSAEETNDEEEEAIIEPDEEDEDVQQEHLLQLEDDDEEAELDQVTFDEEEVEDLSPPAPPASSETQASPSPTARSPTVAKQELIFPPKTPVAKHDLVEQPIKSNKSSEEPNVVFRRSSPTFSAATPAAANVKLDSHQAAHFSTAKFSPTTAPPAVEGKVSIAAATVSSSVLMEVKTCGQNHYQEISSPPSSFVISSPSSFYNHQQQQHQQATTTSCSSSPSRPKSYEAKFSPRVHTTSNYVVTNFVPSQEISPPVSAGIGAASASSSSHRLAAQEAVNHREAGYHYPQHQHPQSQSQQYHPYGHPFVHQHSFHHRQHQQPQPAGSQSYNQRSSSFFASSSSSPSSASSAGYHSGASSFPSEASTPSSPFVYSRGGAAAIPAAGDTSYCQPQSQHYRSFDAEFGSQPSSHQRLPSIRTLFGNSFMDDYHPQRARIVNSSHKE